MTERFVLWRESFLNCAAIDSPKVSHIERYSIHAYISGFQVGFVKKHEVRTDAVKWYILILPEYHEAFERGDIGLRRTDFAQLLQLSDDSMHKVKER